MCLLFYSLWDKVKCVMDCATGNKEEFTQINIDFANKLFNDLKTQLKDLSYTGYVRLLANHNNTSINLASESTYNKLFSITNLQVSDILNAL